MSDYKINIGRRGVKKIKSMQSFLGLAQWLMREINNFMIKENIKWEKV